MAGTIPLIKIAEIAVIARNRRNRKSKPLPRTNLENFSETTEIAKGRPKLEGKTF
jgi:hypothetical protein